MEVQVLWLDIHKTREKTIWISWRVFLNHKKIDKRVFLNGPPYIDLLEFGLVIQMNEVLDNVFCQHVANFEIKFTCLYCMEK